MKKIVNNQVVNMTAEQEAARAALLAANRAELDHYIQKRIAAYPRIEDQLDMLYKDLKNGTANWVDMIDTIKSSNPKS